jgi:FkbM family methyltransferase
MSTTLTSASGDTASAVELRRSAAAPIERWATWALHLIGRAVLDCAYLVRSPHSGPNKVRILLEYVRLTLKLLLGADPPGVRSERVMGYRVRHFGSGSLQFLFREIFVRGEYFFATVEERPLVIDCGANIGLATLFFKWLHPRCAVHAFEPDPVTFAALKENVEQNGLADVHLHNVALCDTNSAVEFYVPTVGSGSLMMSLLPGRMPEAETRRIVVEGRTLSSYLEGREVDFLKMDIEGAESPVLRELARAGSLRRVKEMVVEYHHNLQGGSDGFAGFLQLLEDSGCQYQVDATRGTGQSSPFQDVLVWARQAPASPSLTPRP